MKSYLVSILLTSLVMLTLTSCSTGSFKSTINHDELDLLISESYMRYNVDRLEKLSISSKNPIINALISCHEEKFTKGLNLLQENMEKNKTNPFYWNALGNCFYLQNNFAKAIFYYNMGLESSRQKQNEAISSKATALINNNMALIHLKNDRIDDAFELLTEAIKLDKKLFTPQFNQAQILLEFNKTNQAMDIFMGLLNSNPRDIDLLYSVALGYFKMGKLDESYKYITKINQDYLNRPDIVGLYAYNLLNKGRLAEAKTILEKRLYSKEYNKRNEEILELVNAKIKDAKSSQVN